jgi:hypothetical protein
MKLTGKPEGIKVNKTFNEIRKSLNSIRAGKILLRKVKVIRHEKTIHCELAEWLVADFFDGIRAISGNQKGWDIQLQDGRKIQVKSHAKARTNGSNWTTLSPFSKGVDEILIIVFSPDYFILEIFQVDCKTGYSLCNQKRELTWPKLRKAGKTIDLAPFRKRFPFFFN